ncbi:MAG: DegV family protein, partial [Erysipelotrichaceae bacterium]
YGVDPKLILEKVKTSKECPKTACPAPGDFIRFFEKHEGKRIYVVTLSSKLSGSYSSAVMAKDIYLEDYPDASITVFDSMSASAGQGLIVSMILQYEESLKQFNEICLKIDEFIKNMRTIFVLEDLTFLEKNGRLKGVMLMASKLLSISPILEGKEGDIVLKDKAIGNVRAIDKMISFMVEDMKNLNVKVMQISHCNALNKANKIKDAILDKFPDIKVVIAHTGPIATFYAGDKGVVCSY